jgi:hypothetical protein
MKVAHSIGTQGEIGIQRTHAIENGLLSTLDMKDKRPGLNT